MGSVKPKLAVILGCVLLGLVANAQSLDYWEKSPDLWREITERRKIHVSAMNEGGQTHSKGVGLVRTSVSRLWAFATDPEKIKKSSRFLKDFRWDQKTGDVHLTLEMLSIEHQLKGRAELFPDRDNPRIEFKVLEGSLVPFNGVLELRSSVAQDRRMEKLGLLKEDASDTERVPRFSKELSLVRIGGTSAPGRELSWPLRIAMEAVLQRTAGALREAVEADNGMRTTAGNSSEKEAP